jgi:hypothetical protein
MSKKQVNTNDPVLTPVVTSNGSGIAGYFTAILGKVINFFSGSGSLEKRKSRASNNETTTQNTVTTIQHDGLSQSQSPRRGRKVETVAISQRLNTLKKTLGIAT